MSGSRQSRRLVHLLPASIQARFLVLLAVTLVPALVLLAVIYSQRYQERRKQEFQANLEIARAMARAFDAFVDSVTWHEAALGSALVGLAPYSRGSANHLLAASAREYPAVEEFEWLSAQGRVLASSTPGTVGTDLTRSPDFRPARAGETLVGSLRRAEGTGEWRFTVWRGIAGSHGELAGMMSASIVPQQLAEVGLAIRRADGGGVSLVDRSGRLVFRCAPPAPYTVGEDWGRAYAPLRSALRGRESLATVADVTMRGQQRIAAWVPIPAVGWVAGAGRPEEAAMSAIRRDLARDAALTLFVDALALLAALRISRSISTPVRRLEADAGRLGAGDLAHRAETGGPAELERLGSAFNAMAARLQEQNEALRQSEERARTHAARLQVTLDAAPAIIWTAHDRDCRSITGNRAAYDFSRVPEGEDLAKTAPAPEHPAHFHVLKDGAELAPEEMPIQQVAASGQPQHDCALEFRFDDGRARTLLGNVVPVLDADGCPDGAIAAFVDITPLRHAELALRAAHRRLQFHVGNTPLAVVEHDRDFVITRWAAEAERIFGWTEKETVGRRIDSFPFIYPPDLPLVKQTMAAMAGGASASNVTRNRNLTREGRVIHCEWYNSALYDEHGSLVSVFSLALDVTERTELQTALQERVREIETLMDVAPVAIWVAHDPECRVLTGNAYADERVMQIPRGGNISRSALPGEAAVFYRVFRDGVELAPEQLPAQVAAATGRPFDDVEVDVRFEDGRIVHLILAAAPLFNAAGSVRGSVLIGLDVSHLRQAEEEVRRRGIEVEALNVRLRRAMAETHHRVKNNLQVIAALIDMQAMTDSATVPVAELARLGRHVRGLAAIHDLLTQEARANGDAESISVREALQKLKPLLDNMVGGRDLRFHVQDLKLPARQATGMAVLVNELVSNAVKHGEGAIDLSLAVVGGCASLAVRDHGHGFPEGFDPTQRANTGLELVESVGGWDLQGEVSFANSPDGGACVTVRFPVADQHAEHGQ